MQRNRICARVIAAALAAVTTAGLLPAHVVCARPADTISGEMYSYESMIVSPEALDNDLRVLQTVPSIKGGKVGGVGATISDETRAAIENAFTAYTRYNHEVSFVLQDLVTGRTLYYNTGLNVYSASCIKGPYIISCLAAGNDATNDMYLTGHYSDNDAYHRIRDEYGSRNFMAWLRSIDVKPSIGQYYYCHLTSMDLIKMWRAMYPYIVGNESGSRDARTIFLDSRNSVLAAGPGQTRTVYSKAGWISSNEEPDYNVYNVGGIVMDEMPYIVAITSTARGTTEEAQALVNLLDTAHEEMIADVLAAQQAAQTAAAQQAAEADATQTATDPAAAQTATQTIPTAPATTTTTTPAAQGIIPATPTTPATDAAGAAASTAIPTTIPTTTP